jgi:hypothetical protein
MVALSRLGLGAGRTAVRRRALLGLGLLAQAACVGAVGRLDLFDFLADGATRKEDVLLRLGQPGGTLQGERVLTYRVGEDRGGYFLDPVTVRPVFSYRAYSLVLIFDDAGVLRRHALVPLSALPESGSVY